MLSRQDDSVQLLNDLDPRLLELLRTGINTFIKWDVMRFFHANPHTAEAAETLAGQLGRDVRVVEPELRELARDGLLVTEEMMADVPVYALATGEHMVALLDSFMHACADRQFRVKATYHIIRGLR